MKKVILLTAALIFSIGIYAQEPLVYTDVVYLNDSSLSKDDIYSATKEWIAINFKSAQKVIQLDDKESGRIIVKGNFYEGGTFIIGECRINFTLTIMIKDGKFKYEYIDIYHTSVLGSMYDGGDLGDEKADCLGLYMAKKAWKQLKEISEARSYSSMMSLKSAIENYSAKEDEW